MRSSKSQPPRLERHRCSTQRPAREVLCTSTSRRLFRVQMTLKVGGEYEPTLRLLELRDDQWPSGSSSIRFALRGTAFLVVSLNSEVGVVFYTAWRRQQGADPVAGVDKRAPSGGGCSRYAPEALPAASEPLAPIGTASALRPVYAKSVVHDHFSGGVWKSLPSQPQQSHHQPQPQQQPPQPVGAGAWHSSSARHHSCSAPGAHLELGALLHGVQQNREALSSLVQHSGSSQSRPPTSLSDFGGRPGGGLQLSAESRPSTSLAPFGGAAAAAATAHALQECWSRGSPPSGPPLLRFNYDLLPSGYLHWLALARSNLARPQAMAAAFFYFGVCLLVTPAELPGFRPQRDGITRARRPGVSTMTSRPLKHQPASGGADNSIVWHPARRYWRCLQRVTHEYNEGGTQDVYPAVQHR
ncbi:hypothetical protein HPB48_018371 [Haemaphysalis longicornis]|uniref:Uncharacterized protein n=1 Tax=Haemaphysalis longicornis TaxID=44386 RepID=A0A9J6G4J3_HAELO|nr:hypothetical protein HPB48_018371 [Haemaphysalis longicornis]